MACAGFESVTESERAEGGISPGASSSDGKPVPIDLTAFYKIPGAIDAVIYVNNSPAAFESFSVFTAVS